MRTRHIAKKCLIKLILGKTGIKVWASWNIKYQKYILRTYSCPWANQGLLDGTALRAILSYLIVQTLFLNKEYLLKYHINQVIMVAKNYKILTSKQIISEELILFTSLLKINWKKLR